MTKSRQTLEGNRSLEEWTCIEIHFQTVFPWGPLQPTRAEILDLRQKMSYWLEASKDRIWGHQNGRKLRGKTLKRRESFINLEFWIWKKPQNLWKKKKAKLLLNHWLTSKLYLHTGDAKGNKKTLKAFILEGKK